MMLKPENQKIKGLNGKKRRKIHMQTFLNIPIVIHKGVLSS